MRLLTLCTRNLFRRKFRTALCITGVTLATMFIVAIGATTTRYATVIKEMNVLFNDQVLVVGKDALMIQSIPLGSNLAEKTANEIQQRVNLAQKSVPVLFLTPISMGSVLQPVPLNFTLGVPVKDWQVLLGTTPLETSGHWPTNESGNEIVVGAFLAYHFNWTVGSELTVNGYELRVDGVLDSDFVILSRSLVMPLQLAQRIYTYPMQISMIAVTPIANHSEEELASSIDQQIAGVKALTMSERNDMIQPILSQVETWNVGIWTIVFLLSLILVLTVTTMNVSERRRDFATLDAIGAPLSYVFRIVIVEAVLIGLIGGIIGLAAGSLVALALASFYGNVPIQHLFPSLFSPSSSVVHDRNIRLQHSCMLHRRNNTCRQSSKHKNL